MGSIFSSPQFTKEQMEIALTKAKQIVSSNPVVVFSKTYCGYCTRVKQLLSQLGATFKVIELDQESDGGEVQHALLEWTRQRTVPNVFIGGEHVGGCDSVLEKHQQGKLLPMLKDAAAIPNNPARV
ncbi:hypothetical protein RDI58_008608 [Solanum bulbocastanum]|uniref:Glutaredoxin domain-containing protein n=1 Tax=Solanum bulbocastanum TaxID=147425 RepID=A0AAN8TW49_SOLBU